MVYLGTKQQINEKEINRYLLLENIESRVEIVNIVDNIAEFKFLSDDIKGIKAKVIYENQYQIPNFYIENNFNKVNIKYKYHGYREKTKFIGYNHICLGNSKDLIIHQYNPNQLIVKILARFFGNFIDVSYDESRKSLYDECALYFRNKVKNRIRVDIRGKDLKTAYVYFKDDDQRIIITDEKLKDKTRKLSYFLKVDGNKVKNSIYSLLALNEHKKLLIDLLSNCVSTKLKNQNETKLAAKDFILVIDIIDDTNSFMLVFQVKTIGQHTKTTTVLKHIIINNTEVQLISISGDYCCNDIRKETLIKRTMGKDEIGNKVITLVGVGAVGSYISEQLSTMYFGKLNIIDGDNLSVNNILRFSSGTIEQGYNRKEKVQLIKDYLKTKNLYINIIEYNKYFFEYSKEQINEIANESDLFIISIDNLNTVFEIEKLLKMHEKSYIITWLEQHGIGMHALYINSRENIYFKDFFNFENGKNKYNFLNVNERKLMRHSDGCGGTYIQHGAIAAINCASLTSQLVQKHFNDQDNESILLQQKALAIPDAYKESLTSWYHSTSSEIVTLTKLKEDEV